MGNYSADYGMFIKRLLYHIKHWNKASSIDQGIGGSANGKHEGVGAGQGGRKGEVKIVDVQTLSLECMYYLYLVCSMRGQPREGGPTKCRPTK